MAESEPDGGSVTRMIAGLKAGDEQAAQQLWETYCQRLVGFARRKLGNTPRRIADEDDVAVDAFHSLCRGAQRGRFRRLHDRDDLWQLLIVISSRKAADQIEREHRQKRGGGQVRGESVFMSGKSASAVGIDRVIGEEPTPEFVAILSEEFHHLLDLLNDDVLRRIALLKLEQDTNQEIAAKTGLSLRAVERKLRLIRQTWDRPDVR